MLRTIKAVHFTAEAGNATHVNNAQHVALLPACSLLQHSISAFDSGYCAAVACPSIFNFLLSKIEGYLKPVA